MTQIKKLFFAAALAAALCPRAHSAPQNPHNYIEGERYELRPTQKVGKFGENYDTSKIDIYKKLDILDKIDASGRITSVQDWLKQRPQVMDFVSRKLYTPVPPRPRSVQFRLLERSDNALNGAAIRMQFAVISGDERGEHSFTLLLYVPKNVEKPAVFIHQNFMGNHAAIDDGDVIIPVCYLDSDNSSGEKTLPEREKCRNTRAYRHPIREVVAAGYAYATFCYNELYPDKYATQKSGVNESIYKIYNPNRFKITPQAIAAWAFGNILALDCLESVAEVDASRAAVVGHSRLGKAALYAGAVDERFKIVVSNSSCILGARMNRRNFGGTAKIAVESSTRWYSPELKKYVENVETMPIDQQHLLACIAPRALYVASATDDYWCDPEGEFMSLLQACEIYKLFGAKNTPTPADLKVQTPFIGDVGHHIRIGNHNILLYDWLQYIKFADSKFGKPVFVSK